MSTDIIQVQRTQLERIAGKLSGSAANSEQLLRRVQTSVERLRDEGWRGQGSEAFFSEMNRDVYPAMLRLQAALEQAQAFVIQSNHIFEAAEAEAAALFRSEPTAQPLAGTGTESAASEGEASIKNMRDLAKEVMALNQAGTPIKIVDLGNNKYLVMIAGTTPEPSNLLKNPYDITKGNGWYSALRGRLFNDSKYIDRVRELVQNLPEGAQIHLAGHSQGGHVARTIAWQLSQEGNYKVESVITFGSDSNTKQVPHVAYHNYIYEKDVLAPFDKLSKYTRLGDPLDRYPDTYFLKGDEGELQDMGPAEVHGYYKNPESVIAKYPLPFGAISLDQPVRYAADGTPITGAFKVDNVTPGEFIRDMSSVNLTKETLKFAIDRVPDVEYYVGQGMKSAGDTLHKTFDNLKNDVNWVSEEAKEIIDKHSPL